MSSPDSGDELFTEEEVATFIMDVARKYTELDRGIRRQIDRNRPVNGPQPDGGVHDDMVQRCHLILIENLDKIVKSGLSRAYCRSLLRSVPADHSYRTSGWQLTEWDSKQLHKARQMAKAERPNADTDTQTLLARQIYIDNGGNGLVFDRIHGEPLSLFAGEEWEEGDPQAIVDLAPDPAPGPEELAVDGGGTSHVQISIEMYMREEMDEADREFVDLLVEYKRQGREQQDVAKVLHMKPYEVTRRKQRIQADYLTWKATEAVGDSFEESGESCN